MKTTRYNIFETNSSSSHSITISKDLTATLDSIPLDSKGVLHVYPDEFGWGVDEFTDPEPKASYCYTWVKLNSDASKLAMLESVLKKQTGAKKVIFHTLTEYEEELKADGELTGDDESYGLGGSIDHQSHDVAEEAFTSSKKLKQFIFNPKSVLKLDNDNH